MHIYKCMCHVATGYISCLYYLITVLIQGFIFNYWYFISLIMTKLQATFSSYSHFANSHFATHDVTLESSHFFTLNFVYIIHIKF